MKLFRKTKQGLKQRGQILPMLALCFVVLILFLALAVDLGFAYIARANLSKAVDAAALQGMRNLNLGTAAAATAAQNTFAANYNAVGSNGKVPVPNITFPVDSNGKTTVQVTVSTSMNTLFAKVLPQLSTMTVGSSATAVQAQLIMSLVLDRSGSMTSDGGQSALQNAVPQFVNLWTEGVDKLALTSFASTATTNVSLTSTFKSSITSAVSSMPFIGATFTYGGLSLADTQINSVAISPGQNVAKVVVLFTDGIANTNQDNLSCPGYPLVNYGGNAPSEGNCVWFMNTSTGATLPGNSVVCGQRGQPPACQFTSGGQPSCCTATGFQSQQYGTKKSYTTTNITNEAEYRVTTLANSMRSETVPTTIYTMGLGTDINVNFLKEVANTTDSDTYNSSQPSGKMYQIANCPSSTCTADVAAAFQDIANDILLRLSK